MASDINVTTAAFATTNMKPGPDEQIDCLWGQNLADNTGYLYTYMGSSLANSVRPEMAFQALYTSPSTNLAAGTYFFQKRAGMTGNGTLFGSVNGFHDDGGVVPARNFRLYIDGTLVYSAGATAGAFSGHFGTDLRSVSGGGIAKVTWDFGASPGAYSSAAWVTCWSKG
jgi:hypothetical protein